MKKVFIFFTFIFLITIFASNIYAGEEKENIFNNIYSEQFKISGADSLENSIPKESSEILKDMDIDVKDWKSIASVTPDKIFSQINKVGKKKISSPFGSLMPVLAIILLNAIIHSIKTTFGSEHIGKIISSISTLCVCMSIVDPIVKSISSMSAVIKGAAGFILCYIPVMTTIMVASGQSISATSYHVMMIVAGQVISQVSSNFLVPCMNTVLGISIVSSTSETLNLDKICDMFHKITKWILGFSVSIFVGLLTLQNLVSSSADSIGSKTMKFALTSFVPVVGSALSDAFNTVEGCVKLLKSGVGAFGVIAGGAIFMPIIIECSVWIIFLHICVYFGEIFGLTKICSLLKSSSKVMETMFAIIFASMLVLAVSTVLMLVIGGNG